MAQVTKWWDEWVQKQNEIGYWTVSKKWIMRYAWDLKKDGSCCEWSDMLMNSILEREREYNIKNNANLETVLFHVWRWEMKKFGAKNACKRGLWESQMLGIKEQGRIICHVLEKKGDITLKGSYEQDFLISLMTREARSEERMSELYKGWLRAKGWYILKE